ncbi:pentapeptide repeat-containing protein [Aquimarina sp. 2201CG5-10]|uniref:pentapeptide repeat-containing protein n=1 Tax=Aquimarina callyspongiae TaxID=3098150 RepID=UPI002AB5693F|nr:pentapeptide repeat-containing protein [Aquimarina sp. 2201CG5-10]MDY8136598.1 pentapeptide repeat-containing protein [Aquimarina sp. 2201CG5-10]
MNEQDYIERLKRENEILQDKLDQINKAKERKRKFKWWLFRKSSTPIFGNRLKRSISNAINEYKEYKTVSVDTVSDVSSSIVWRITRIGLFAFLFAILPSMVLIFQTMLLKNQNELVDNQSDLVESQRRSSLVFVMDNVLGDLNDELKYKGVNSANNISNTLEARIVSLSRAMKPYKYKEGNKLIEKEISPERGQLLYSLVKSDLGEQSLSDIFRTGDFEYSDLKDAYLGEKFFLRYIKLNHSNLSRAHMPKADLSNSELIDAEMDNVNLSEAILKRASLKRANLKKSELAGADLTYANLFEADLTGADLSEAKLWGTKLNEADLTDVILDNAIVHREDWIAYVSDSLDLDGSSSIERRYRLKKQSKQQFIIVPRN